MAEKKVVVDSNKVPLKRGDHIWNLNEGFLSCDRKGIIVEIIDEDHLRYSPESDPCGIMNESPWLVIKEKDASVGFRNDYAEENQELKEQLKEVRTIVHSEKHHKGDRCDCMGRILKATRCLDKGGD